MILMIRCRVIWSIGAYSVCVPNECSIWKRFSWFCFLKKFSRSCEYENRENFSRLFWSVDTILYNARYIGKKLRLEEQSLSDAFVSAAHQFWHKNCCRCGSQEWYLWKYLEEFLYQGYRLNRSRSQSRFHNWKVVILWINKINAWTL